MSDTKHFVHELGATVKRVANGKTGTVQARTHYNRDYPNNYLVEYIDGKGDVASEWLSEAELATA